MGVPAKVLIKGQPVFLCCPACKEKALANPDDTLTKVEQLKAKGNASSKMELRSPPPAHPVLSQEEEADISAALAKLSPEDRRLAEAQVFCAGTPENRLGSMGTPLKVMIKGQPVFLCCEGCKQRALANPDQTLATAEKLKAVAKSAAPK